MLFHHGLGWRFRVLQLVVLALACLGFQLGPSGSATMRDRSDRLVTAVALAWHDGLRVIERPFDLMTPRR